MMNRRNVIVLHETATELITLIRQREEETVKNTMIVKNTMNTHVIQVLIWIVLIMNTINLLCTLIFCCIIYALYICIVYYVWLSNLLKVVHIFKTITNSNKNSQKKCNAIV